MLYKNDEIYKLTAADHKEIKTKFKKFPIRLVYPDSRVRPNPTSHNRLPDKPTSIAFPLVATRKTEAGADNWRYCTNRIVGPNGVVVYTPATLYFKGNLMLDEKDIELIWWLYNICPWMSNGKNYNNKMAKCAIEDLVGIAERKALVEEEKATVKALIYSTQVGLGEKRLRQVAKAYFVPKVDELSYAQVKLAVEHYVYRNKATGVEKFLELIDAKQTLSVRENIQNAIDNDLIKYMQRQRTWAWVTEHGRKNETIVQIAANAEPHEALYDYYLGDRNFAEQLISAIKGSKVVVPDKEEEVTT